MSNSKVINLSLLNEGFFSRRNNRTQHVNDFLNRVRHTQALTRDQETELFDIIRNGTEEEQQEAKEAVIESIQKFVYAMAKRYTNDEQLLLDLISEGNIGILEAIEGFDPTLGTGFLSYAVHYIRKHITSFITSNNIIQKPYQWKTAHIIPKLKKEFFKKHERFPTDSELADLLMDSHNVKINDESILNDLGLVDIDTFVNPEHYDTNSMDFENNPDTYTVNDAETSGDTDQIKYVVAGLLDKLKPREAKIMSLLYGINCDYEHTPEDIAVSLGMTRERVRQLAEESIKKMRALMLEYRVSI